MQEALTGQWRNVYVKMTLHTRTDDNSDTSMVMEADSTNWAARLGIQPIRTYFEKGGTYYSEYRDLKDSIVRRPSGNWSIKGDALTMYQLSPSKTVTTLHVAVTGGRAAFSGLIDFDGDGKLDDAYYGIQRKQQQ